MKAVRKTKEGPGLEFVDIPVPEPGDHEVLVKVKACSMCGTDVHIYNWEHPWSEGRVTPPRTIGHEVCGEVVGSERMLLSFRKGTSYLPSPIFLMANACNAGEGICTYVKI